MSSKFFGNSKEKKPHSNKRGKHKIANTNTKQKSTGVRKVGRGN